MPFRGSSRHNPAVLCCCTLAEFGRKVTERSTLGLISSLTVLRSDLSLNPFFFCLHGSICYPTARLEPQPATLIQSVGLALLATESRGCPNKGGKPEYAKERMVG